MNVLDLGLSFLNKQVHAPFVAASVRPLRVRAGATAVVCSLALGGCELLSGVQGDADVNLYEGVLQTAVSAETGGQYGAAVVQYRKLQAKRPDDPAVILGLARNLRYTGQAGAAIKMLAISAGLKTEQPAFLLEAAKAEIAAGTPSRALEYLVKARFLDDSSWDVHGTMGIAYDMIDAYGDAAAAYARALERSPANPAVINNMAISAALSGDLDRGIEILEGSALTVRRDSQIRQNLALLYGLRGEDEKARMLSSLSLEEEDIRNNLSVYSRLRSGARHTNK